MQATPGPDRWLYAWGIGSVAAGAASLLVPLYVVQLGGGPVDLGLLASSASVVGAPGAIAIGRFADRTGTRRPLLLGALLGVAVTLVILPFVRSVALVIVVNALLWLVWAAVVPVLTMLVVASVPGSEWSERIGRLNAYQGWGWTGGLLLGTAWTLVGSWLFSPLLAQRTLFFVCALCAVGGMAGSARWLPTDSPAGRDTPEARRIARFVTQSHRHIKTATFAFTPNRLYWTTRGIDPRRLLGRFTPALGLYFAASILFFTGFAAFWAPLPVFLTDAGYGSGAVFALFLVASLGSALLYEPAGRVSDRYDIRHVQSGALGVRALLFPAVALVGTSVWVGTLGFAAAVLLLAGVGLTWAVIAVAGTAIVTRLAPPRLRGEVIGVYTALSALAGGVGGILGGWLASLSYRLAFVVAGAFVLVGAVVVFAVRTLSPGAARAPRE